YNVLISSEGKTLVQARYAVRNNQRNFLKVTLPAGATLWSASLAGKPVRPGQAPDGGVLLPLEKAHAGEEAPEFAVELVYVARGTAWNDKGQFKLALPALDLPVSRTGLLVYHPPLFKVTTETGAFQVEAYEAPASAALNTPITENGRNVAATSAPAPSAVNTSSTGAAIFMNVVTMDKEQSDAQKLVDDFKKTLSGGKAVGILPIKVSFPSFGPSLFMVSELTAENQAPSAELNYQHEKKAGGR
ncbi:MAG TPA: hypothetical protein VKH15_11315, partial [Candidatus Acidoferrum sp.]|nr:hypothetical protein [Candidatus Acidoferrum sp.]